MDANKEKAPEGATTEALVSITHEKEIDMSRSNLTQAKKEFTIFRFGGKEIRVIDKAGDPWFVAKDVCGALELTNSRKALTSLDDDEKGVTSTYTPGGNQEVAVVSESGMYTLVLRCRDAVNEGTIPHKFRKWVTAEVLPAIRKTGEYVKGAKTTVDQRTPLRDAVNMLVGKKGLRYDDAYNMVHQRFAIDSIDELALEQIPQAVEYIHRVVLDGEYLGKEVNVSSGFNVEIPSEGRWLVYFRDGKPMVNNIEGNNLIECQLIRNVQRDAIQLMDVLNEFALRTRIMTGDISPSRLDNPLLSSR